MRNFHDTDYHLIQNWQARRGKLAPKKELLPPVGLIEDNAACGFLIHCDNGVGILDFFISNPEIPKEQRDQVLDDIVFALILTAKMAGMKQVYCNSNIWAIKSRAEKHGFANIGEFTSYLKEL